MPAVTESLTDILRNAAVALGGTYVWKDGREHTDTFHALLEYPEGFLLDWSMGLGNSAGNHFDVYGTEGTLDLQNWTVSNAGSTQADCHHPGLPPLTRATLDARSCNCCGYTSGA